MKHIIRYLKRASINLKARLILPVLILISITPLTASAEQQWYFTWSCPKCYKIGARTSGMEGPYATEMACNMDRMRMPQDPGMFVGFCYAVGTPTQPPSQRREEREEEKEAKPTAVPNPAYTAAVRMLEERRTATGKTWNSLVQALKTQQNAVSSYLAPDSLRQLMQSACLAQKAKTVSLSGDLDEAASILQQTDGALKGRYMTATTGCRVSIPEPPAPKAAMVSERYEQVLSKVADIFAVAKEKEEERDQLIERVEKARETVKEAEKNLTDLQQAVRTEEKKGTEESLLREAMAARDDARKELDKIENMAQKADMEYNKARDAANSASQRLADAGTDPQKLDDLWGSFGGK